MSYLQKTIGKFLGFFGLDPRALLAFRWLPRYLRDRSKWRAQGGAISKTYPILIDYGESAGSARGHYFHQDLLVASFIHLRRPKRHIDVGSRIDGFVAHVAAFRKIEVVDIRALPASPHPSIVFLQRDLTAPLEGELADSISCLHAIEHFGLGRYGDPIKVDGHLKGLENLIQMLEPGGTLYISFPIGAQDRVEFNAHRVFAPGSILTWDCVKQSMVLKRFDYVDDIGDLHVDAEIGAVPVGTRYGCGIYTFVKKPLEVAA